jgi:hypothetical protein
MKDSGPLDYNYIRNLAALESSFQEDAVIPYIKEQCGNVDGKIKRILRVPDRFPKITNKDTMCNAISNGGEVSLEVRAGRNTCISNTLIGKLICYCC